MQRKPAGAGVALQVQARADEAGVARCQHRRLEREQRPLRRRRHASVAGALGGNRACAPMHREQRSTQQTAAPTHTPVSSSWKLYSWSKLKALACCTTSSGPLATTAPAGPEKKTTCAITVTWPTVTWKRALEGTAPLKNRIFSTAATCGGTCKQSAAASRQPGTHGAEHRRHASRLGHEAAFHDAGVQLRDADADAITTARLRDGAAKHLHRLDLLHQALRWELHRLPHSHLALQHRAGQDGALPAD